MATEPTIVEITEQVTDISVTDTNLVEISLSPENTTIEINNFAIPLNFLDAENVIFAPHGTVTATNVQDAIEHLADQNFRGTTTPTTNVEEGDTWYDTLNDIFYVYRTINGITDWYPLLATQVDSRLDGGAF